MRVERDNRNMAMGVLLMLSNRFGCQYPIISASEYPLKSDQRCVLQARSDFLSILEQW